MLRFPLFRIALIALPLALVAGCANDGRFVKPVAAPVDATGSTADPSKYADGYLRIFVSSNLDTNGRALDFGPESERPAMLLISAKFGRGTVASFTADTEPEIPVLLYDVREGKIVSAVVDNALLTEGLLVDPESLSKSPHLQIVIRGVPADKAKWVTNLLEIATGEPVLKFGMGFVPGGQVVSGLSSKLGELLSDEIKTEKKPWEEKTLLGLRADEGLSALDGRQFVVLLNSTKVELESAAPNLRRCERTISPSGLCDAKGKPWMTAQAYVRFELDVTDFRSVKDFIGSAISCEADERVWGNYRELIGSGQLARRQSEYERHLLSRGELLLAVRRANNESPSWRRAGRLLHFAQQAVLLPRPDDAYWTEHFRDRALQTEACIRTTASRSQSQYAAIWDSAVRLFSRAQSYPVWAQALSGSSDPESPALRDAERELTQLHQLMSVSELRNLDSESLEGLSSLDAQLQTLLKPVYERVVERIDEDDDTPEGKRQRLADLQTRSACTACRELLAQRAEALRQIVPVPVPVETPPPVPPAAQPS
ncbi:MAG: hypothetical protein K0Q76_933 [Panacagrimonas sp.]|nr:hypothetical protein [Panacagrimonas sp.]